MNRVSDGTGTIAVITDESWYFNSILPKLEAQLISFAGTSYDAEYRFFETDNNSDRAEQLLEEALADPSIDVIFLASAGGASRIMINAGTRELPKPVLVGQLEFSDAHASRITPAGGSSLKNLTFMTTPTRVESDLRLLKEMSGESTLDVLIGEQMRPEIEMRSEVVAEVRENVGVGFRFLWASGSVEQTLAKIPAGTRAIYVSVLPNFAPAQRKALFAGLAERKIITVSMLGISDVRLGAMAGLAPDLIGLGPEAGGGESPGTGAESLPRRAALHLHQMLLGVSPETLPVYFPVRDRLVINMESADVAGWSPTYEFVLKAEFIGDDPYYAGEDLTLNEALKMAAKNNAEVQIAGAAEDVAEQDVNITRSNLLPRVNLEGQHARVDYSDQIPANPPTPDYAHSGTYGVQLNQILFNDEVRSSLQATRFSAEGAKFQTESARLDALEAAALAYFDLLTAEDLYEIERENLNLTRNNLEAARLRIEIGAAENSEVFRWEQAEASGQATLFQRDTDRANALVALNTTLAVPREKRWNLADVELADEDIYFLDDALVPLLTDQESFIKFTDFIQVAAVDLSPELEQFDRSLYAQGIILGQRQRSFFVPAVNGFASQNRFVQGAQSIDTDGQNETTVGVQLSYPIFEGGLRKAEVEQKKAEIRQLAAQREQAVQAIEQRARVSVNTIGATHPNIRLSRRALEAANKNYESVQEKYSRGSASILDLLDAQATLLQQRQSAAVAAYQYLQSIFQLQRALAWFEFEASPEEKQSLTESFSEYLKTGTFTPVSTETAMGVSVAPKVVERVKIAVEEPAADPSPKRKNRFSRLFNRKNASESEQP
ncbi:MAG: TolC family protein [Verrucomicrobiota bacterium]